MKKKLISMAAICLCLMNLTGCDGKAMSEAGLNTLMGMGIVFLVLIFISFIIWLMGFIPKMMSGEKKTAPARQNQKYQLRLPARLLPLSASQKSYRMIWNW